MVESGTLGKEVTMFQIDSLSDKPIYKQIVDQIKSMISKNLLQEGDKLPSVREFSKMLGVNVSTIQKAFQQLESEKIRYNNKFQRNNYYILILLSLS